MTTLAQKTPPPPMAGPVLFLVFVLEIGIIRLVSLAGYGLWYSGGVGIGSIVNPLVSLYS
jgi:hypothetical protein